MKDVGRDVFRFFQPVTFDLEARSVSRMVRSMSRQIIRARMRMSPRASMRRGDLRKSALTNSGSLRNVSGSGLTYMDLGV